MRSDLGMTVVAKIRLTFGEKEFRRGGSVNGVAGGTDDVSLGVLGPANLGASDVLAVASQALVQNALGLELAESDDRRLPASRFDVRLPRPVAPLAPGSFGSFVPRRDRLVMRVFVESRPDVRVTGLTDCASDVWRGVWVGRCL